ncbi:MAG: ethanolamine ammonia-lyase subunit EutC [Litoreibacter sp.]|nr:ethanolamine ammonia-lyase subunit EutC [Litoreibacter sp.]
MSTPTRDPFARLRAATPARIGLGRSGAAQPLSAQLAFQLAHARARDAVHQRLDFDAIASDLAPLETICVRSAAPDRATYLRRPDLGRRLAENTELPRLEVDVALVIADGLSSDAVQSHAAPTAQAIIAALPELRFSPVILAEQARVAIGDEIGACLGARVTILLIGERPGLTVADSLGAYLTFAPKPGTRDSARNCVSNIHGQGGLSTAQAANTIAWITREAFRLKLTGTGLKDRSDQTIERNFPGQDAER